MTTRVRYFDGQLLSTADFQTEQDYVRGRFRRLHRWLHGPVEEVCQGMFSAELIVRLRAASA